MKRSLPRLLAYGAVALATGAATAAVLQGLLASRLEWAATRRLAAETALSLRLADVALERLPREAVAEQSGLVLAPRPAAMGTEWPAGVRRQGQLLERELCHQLGACPTVSRQGLPLPGLWVELPNAVESTWLFTALPRARLWPPRPPVLSLALLAGALVVTTLYLELEVRRPLGRLQRSLGAVDPDQTPAAIPAAGAAAVRQVSAQFNAMVMRLNAAQRERATMLAGISHDLAAPITRLRLRLALAEARRLGAAEVRRVMADLDALERISSQFQSFASPAAAETPLLLQLDELVGEAVAGLDAPITLALTPLERAVRPIGLGRAVRNLAENALIHGAPPLHLWLEPAPQLGNLGFGVGVADCGHGIAPEQWRQALEPFQRLDAARGGSGHCGLGLAIAQQVARAHGGWLERRTLSPSPEAPQRFAVVLLGCSAAPAGHGLS